jgi:hypothetical protein
MTLCAPPYVTFPTCSDVYYLPHRSPFLVGSSPTFEAVVQGCLQAHYTPCLSTPLPAGGSLSPICFASHRALSQLTSPCDSNRVRPLHTFCGCLLGSAACPSISVIAPVTTCCNPLTSCHRCLAHSWVVGVLSGVVTSDLRSCQSTQLCAGCC